MVRTAPLKTAALAVLGLAAVGLAGCSTPTEASCVRPASDSAALDLVTVSDDFGSTPQIDLYTPFHADEASAVDVVVGDGQRITDERQLIAFDLALVSGQSGEVLGEYAGQTGQVSTFEQLLPAMPDALHCVTAGSRVVVALSPDDITSEFAAGLGMAADESAVAVIDVRDVYLAQANGADVFVSDNSLPAVVRAVDGRPGVIVPDSAPPSDVVVQTLKKGDGATVTGDAPVRVHFVAVDWDTKEQTQSTWDTEPPSISLEAESPVLAEALTGQTVGSQVLVVLPAGAGAGGAPATTILVLDILGIDPAVSE